MKKLSIISCSLIGLISCSQGILDKKKDLPKTSGDARVRLREGGFIYPKTKKMSHEDQYFGTRVVDPFRWLEDDTSEETARWVKSQNLYSHEYLQGLPNRDKIRRKLNEFWNYERQSGPIEKGDASYYFRNEGLQDQSVLYVKKQGQDAEVFLDPNTLSEDGTVALDQYSFSEDGSLFAYSTSTGGSDWRKVYVMNVASREVVDGPLIGVKFSGISWLRNEGFYYSQYEFPDGSELSAKTDQHLLRYHIVGQEQQEDQTVFGASLAQKHRYVGGNVTEDGHFLIISGANSTTGNTLYAKDLRNANRPLIVLARDDSADVSYLSSQEGRVYLQTNKDAPKNRVVSIDLASNNKLIWNNVIAESDYVLDAQVAGPYIFAEYMKDAISVVKQFDFDGTFVSELNLPGKGSVALNRGDIQAKQLYFSYTDYKTPTSIYRYDFASQSQSLFFKPQMSFDSDLYESKQVFYRSKDGTKIPMMITYKKGIKLDAKTPTILYGYGGFNISLTPSFSVANAVWLDLGGVYAVANLRGGGEYGQDWHDAGTQLNKQNVFDDFIAAAEYLTEEGYTSKDYLALRGGSNGGLLVGAVLTQRPDLFKVALPAVGVLDMLRYHKFTAGAGWAYDYGTSDQSKEMFEYLLSYSPVHNVRSGASYPATLITTGDHDDRVVPAHSFKFAAQLQEKQAGPLPVMIRIETDGGHGAGTPVSKLVDQYTDIFSFTLHNFGH